MVFPSFCRFNPLGVSRTSPVILKVVCVCVYVNRNPSRTQKRCEASPWTYMPALHAMKNSRVDRRNRKIYWRLNACEEIDNPGHKCKELANLMAVLRSVGPHNAIVAHNGIGSPKTTPSRCYSPLYCLARTRLVTAPWGTRTSNTNYPDPTLDMCPHIWYW